MSSTKKLRVGVIGTGTFAGICHVPGLQSHPRAEVVAICGRRKDHTRDVANRLGVPDIHTDYQELCARRDIDAITIATPNAEHARQACRALEAGKHVFCEKPLGMTVAEARQMVSAAEASATLHQVAFTYRYLFGVQELRRRVLQGDIGPPLYVRAQFDSWDGLQPTYQVGFRDKRALAGGGMLYDVGSHFFDLARYVLGPIKSVTGFARLVPRKRTDARTGEPVDIETDDFAAAWFLHENGVPGQWFVSRVTPPLAERSYLEVIGQEGALRASLSRGTVDALRLSTPARPAWDEVPLPEYVRDGSPHCLGRMMRSFVDACLRGKLDDNVDASFYDGLAAQLALSAVDRTADRSTWLELKELG